MIGAGWPKIGLLQRSDCWNDRSRCLNQNGKPVWSRPRLSDRTIRLIHAVSVSPDPIGRIGAFSALIRPLENTFLNPSGASDRLEELEKANFGIDCVDIA